eukprot:TRINITY_DN3364_c0_g1_i1.p1 TRINITY_DN3364_c0_g1~~TRINITY_DN3364_c0_g1_i1.p1  ORF type:complete len:334 (-),score=35.11 TRINITY_DN3364_c0_g1_i1:136-1137(-)
MWKRVNFDYILRTTFQRSSLKHTQRFYSSKGNKWFKSRDSDLVHFNSSNQSSGNQPPFIKRLIFLGKGFLYFAPVAGCYYVYHLEKVPISGRTRMMDVSKKTEMSMGEQTWMVIKYNYSEQMLPQNHPTTLLVKKVAQRLIEVSDLKDLKWEFVVIDSPEANAFVIPGGKVCVFTGLFEIVKNEDQLATVLSHEIAHVVARHSAENWSWTRIVIGINFVVSMIFQINPNSLLQPALMLGITLPKSRAAEAEADHIGLHLMAKACYNLSAAPTLWENFEKAQGHKKPQWVYLSTHPTNRDRKKNIEGWLPEAQRIQENSDCSHLETNFNNFRNY